MSCSGLLQVLHIGLLGAERLRRFEQGLSPGVGEVGLYTSPHAVPAKVGLDAQIAPEEAVLPVPTRTPASLRRCPPARPRPAARKSVRGCGCARWPNMIAHLGATGRDGVDGRQGVPGPPPGIRPGGPGSGSSRSRAGRRDQDAAGHGEAGRVVFADATCPGLCARTSPQARSAGLGDLLADRLDLRVLADAGYQGAWWLRRPAA